MNKYIESKYIRDCFEEIGFELTDFQKATIIWNKYSLTYNERLDELLKLSESTSDLQLKEQIKERIEYEEKVFVHLKARDNDNVVYIVNAEDSLQGIFTKFDTALLQAKIIGSEGWIEDGIRIEKHLTVTGDEVPVEEKEGPFGSYTETYCGCPVAYVQLDKNGEIMYVFSDELREEEKKVDHKYNNERFEFCFLELPFVHIKGAPVKNVVTGKYGIMATDKKEWDEFLDKVRDGLHVDYADVSHMVFCLTKDGIWSHEHWNPIETEIEVPNGDWSDNKVRTYERAMEALSDYMSGHTGEANERMVVRLAREHALACHSDKIISEDATIKDILC